MQDRSTMGEPPSFAGKVVLISGCGQDLSEATARLCAQHGAAGVLLGGRGVEQGQAVAAIVSAAGCPAHFQPTDLTKLDDCAALVAKADQAFGRIDVVIFSAGMLPPRTNLESLADQFDHLFAVNVRAPFFLMRRAGEVMQREVTPGVMVTIVGLPGAGDPPLVASYDAAQAALARLTASFAADGAIDSIRVLGLDVSALPATPADRLVSPQAIATAIARLASDHCTVASGSVAPVDQLLATPARAGSQHGARGAR
jgi:NAD(P)-dependent dehydrogenase (short-subunit alcohol dehydrogenase family)